MSVEIRAGHAGSDGVPDLPPEVVLERAVANAEKVLSRRFGATVRLADPVPLSTQPTPEGQRAVIARVRVAVSPFSHPKTLVIKRYRREVPPSRFALEAAARQLSTALAGNLRVSPELVGHDAAARLLVLEDLGRAPTLADRLLGSDHRAAESALLGWARALGRMHVTTASREADFEALLRRFGQQVWRDPAEIAVNRAVREVPDLLHAELGIDPRPVIQEYAERAALDVLGSQFRALSAAGRCPDDCLVTSKGVRFLDFDGACVRSVLLDAAYLRSPFPGCWCTFALPTGMSEAMLAAWRSEVTAVWPELSDDTVLDRLLLQAQLLWVWRSTWACLAQLAQDNWPTDTHLHLPAPRRANALAARWQRLMEDAGRAGDATVVEHCAGVVKALGDRFGASTLTHELYPAFR
ncbi:hypothetical protein D5S17_04900 [Pseudonocardiaceae bacterium YIM PH 21723]|nr:hypothetical protein D5S17_04900 [Pseudonocardiaceae bacterium YIM PH 21723]